MTGAELAMMEVIEGLMARGVECRVVVPWPGALLDECNFRGIMCDVCFFRWWVTWRLLLKRRMMVWQQLTKGWKIAGLLSSWKPDVVVTNTICMAVGAFAARKLGSAHVWYIHEFGLLDHGLQFLLGRRLSLWLMNLYSDAVICNSQAVAQHFSDGITAAKRRTIPYRMKPPAEAAEGAAADLRHDSSLNCLMLGRVTPSKRQEDAVVAVGQLVRAGLDVRLSIVGEQDSGYKKILDRVIDAYGVSDRVEFVDWVRDPRPYVRTADVLLMCSRMEAFGRVTVEAMQLGRPVIGARSGGTTELIRDGQTGLLFDVGNPADLAQKIRQVYEQRNLLTKLGTAARVWTDEAFSEEATTGQIYELLCECASKRPRTAIAPETVMPH
jgi:glycosyltransferase involved in cell wall biosynthesis